jgi:prepilin-type N-terminal cleavage/methylation domain-containing protein
MKKKTKNFGFTLVELLIVITLIAILAVAIVATLNPIEQINRARDARYKNDASELLAAIERYYASTQEYPWQVVDSTYTSNSTLYTGLGEYAGVGICSGTDGDAAGTCTIEAPGVLITGYELKEQFVSKDQFNDPATLTDLDRFYVYKPEAQSSVYVCFIPKANINHTPTTQVKLWDLGITSTTGAASTPTKIDEITTAPAAEILWETRINSYFMCVPE